MPLRTRSPLHPFPANPGEIEVSLGPPPLSVLKSDDEMLDDDVRVMGSEIARDTDIRSLVARVGAMFMGGVDHEEDATLERHDLPVYGGAVCEVNELCPEVEGAGRFLMADGVRCGEDEEEDDDIRRGERMGRIAAPECTLHIRDAPIPGLVATRSHGRD